jgi:hypothetical protein
MTQRRMIQPKGLRSAVLAGSLLLIIASVVLATVTTVPDSNLVSSTQYYTDTIGGGIGTAAIMTGGGNASNVGGSRNDDGFDGPLNLGFTLNFFGINYTQYWANNNGNISFGNGIAAFTPSGPQGASQPIISPFFGDVDTRNAASGLMYIRSNIPNEIIVTWDQVGYYSQNADKLDSFQLVLRGPGYTVPPGEGQVGFWYKSMQWETGDASGGSGGFGGTPAAVGFGDGNSNGSVLQGSTQNGIAAIVNNKHIWFNIVGGVPTPTGGPTPVTATPLPGTIWLVTLGVMGLGLWQFLRRRERNA